MALRLSIENTSVGVAFSAAYARVEGIDIHYTSSEDLESHTLVLAAYVLVSFYATEEARFNNAQPVHRQSFRMSVPSGDLMPGVYNQLKTLPEFAEAEDC